MTTAPAPEPTPAEEALRWGWSAEALVNASNAVEDAAELLAHPDVATAFDTVRQPSPSADANRAELLGLSVRLADAAQACRARQEAALARVPAPVDPVDPLDFGADHPEPEDGLYTAQEGPQ